MENASRALLMAASVLVGILIISVGVALFSSFAGSNKNIIDKIEESKISEFNNRFFKYYGEGKEVTAHDVITIVNVARQNNNELEGTSPDYIRVQLNSETNFEKKTEEEYIEFIKNNMLVEDDSTGKITKTKLYECTDIKISTETGKVVLVKIQDKK